MTLHLPAPDAAATASHDPDRARLALRAAHVRWSVESSPPVAPTSPFSVGPTIADGCDPLFST